MTAINVPVEDRNLTRRTILLVEDNPDDQELTIRALRRSNVLNQVVVARDGEEALNYLFGQEVFLDRDIDSLPAVVLLDLKLPKIGGIEVLRQIRANAHTRRLPVVVLTSSQEERDLAQVYSLGANSFLHKPVDFEKFSEAVGHLGMYWVLFNESPPVKNAARPGDPGFVRRFKLNFRFHPPISADAPIGRASRRLWAPAIRLRSRGWRNRRGGCSRVAVAEVDLPAGGFGIAGRQRHLHAAVSRRRSRTCRCRGRASNAPARPRDNV